MPNSNNLLSDSQYDSSVNTSPGPRGLEASVYW